MEQCVICHKDISKELPKTDVYGKHYCKVCYADKCEKELLKEKQAKGEIVELPCLRKTKSTLPKYEVVYIDEYDKVVVERFTYENGAQRRLAELKGEEV